MYMKHQPMYTHIHRYLLQTLQQVTMNKSNASAITY